MRQGKCGKHMALPEGSGKEDGVHKGEWRMRRSMFLPYWGEYIMHTSEGGRQYACLSAMQDIWLFMVCQCFVTEIVYAPLWMHVWEFLVLALIFCWNPPSPLSRLFSLFQSRTFPQHVLSATLDLPGQPGLGLCSAFLLGQLCHFMWDFEALTNMDIPARGLSILALVLEEDRSYTS